MDICASVLFCPLKLVGVASSTVSCFVLPDWEPSPLCVCVCVCACVIAAMCVNSWWQALKAWHSLHVASLTTVQESMHNTHQHSFKFRIFGFLLYCRASNYKKTSWTAQNFTQEIHFRDICIFIMHEITHETNVSNTVGRKERERNWKTAVLLRSSMSCWTSEDAQQLSIEGFITSPFWRGGSSYVAGMSFVLISHFIQQTIEIC